MTHQYHLAVNFWTRKSVSKNMATEKCVADWKKGTQKVVSHDNRPSTAEMTGTRKSVSKKKTTENCVEEWKKWDTEFCVSWWGGKMKQPHCWGYVEYARQCIILESHNAALSDLLGGEEEGGGTCCTKTHKEENEGWENLEILHLVTIHSPCSCSCEEKAASSSRAATSHRAIHRGGERRRRSVHCYHTCRRRTPTSVAPSRRRADQ